ncbi:MAG: mechanosensitive ion channel [Vicingaceae bacterium]|nr:mechanosensitive ion channel [Vicingaceae bacterium]
MMDINEILDYSLFTITKHQFRVITLLTLLLFILGVFVFIKLIKKAIFKKSALELPKKHSLFTIFKYIVVVLAAAISLQIVGVDITVLLAGSAALLVGVGFGLQNLFGDISSGIILLFDATIKVNDVIEVDGIVGRVQKINLRTTSVITREDTFIILPNSVITNNNLINWTYSSISSRFEIKVGVDYSSDVKLVMELMEKAVKAQKEVLSKPEPIVRFEEYGDSSLNFSVFFWCDEVFRVESIKSQIRVRLYELFKENNVEIPFPQRVVHMKQPDN